MLVFPCQIDVIADNLAVEGDIHAFNQWSGLVRPLHDHTLAGDLQGGLEESSFIPGIIRRDDLSQNLSRFSRSADPCAS